MSWLAIALSRALQAKPLRVIVAEGPVVLFREAGQIRALSDRCPHRMAPLSGGQIVGGLLQCSYHGWRFDGEGRCRTIPGHLGPLPTIQLRRWQACETGGVIFVAPLGETSKPFVHGVASANPVLRLMESRSAGALVDVAENILDATHTHFTHRGMLRGLSTRRYRVRVDVTGGPDWVEARYTGEARQHGLVSALLEQDRSYSLGRFRAPGIAELEFWGPGGLRLSTTFHLRQETPQTTAGIAVLAGPRDRGLGHLKALLFAPLFRIAMRQDQRVLATCAANSGDQRPVIGPLDFLREDIGRILSGQTPKAAETPRQFEIEL